MGRLPAEVREMTPAETDVLIAAWNEAQQGDDVAPPSSDDYDELVNRYG